MINNLNILLPEIFLAISIMTILMVGVFNKNIHDEIWIITRRKNIVYKWDKQCGIN